jgi:hypothetical protein
MYVFQLFYAAMYAGRNKRVMKYFQFENLLDTCILLISMAYLTILLRDYRSIFSMPSELPQTQVSTQN